MRNRPTVRFTLVAFLVSLSAAALGQNMPPPAQNQPAQNPPAQNQPAPAQSPPATASPSALPPQLPPAQPQSQMPQMPQMPQMEGMAPGVPPQPGAVPQPGDDLPDDPTAIGIETMSVDDQLRLALAYRARNTPEDWTRAVATLAAVLKNDATNIEAQLQIAEISMMRRDFNNGRDYFKKVRSLDENNYRANLGMGQFYLYTRLYRQAVLYLKTAAGVAPPDKKGEALQLLGRAYLESRELNPAQQAIEDALRVDPSNTETARTYVQILMQKQNFEAARAASFQLLQMEQAKVTSSRMDREAVRQFATAYDTVIEVLLQLHNSLHKKNARGQVTDEPLPGQELEIAKVLDAIVQTRVQQMPTMKVMTLLDVLPLAKRSVELAPDNPAYLFTLGYTCAEAGLYGDARAAMQKAVQLEPANSLYQSALQRIEADIARMQQQQQQQAAPPQGPQAPATAPPPPGAMPQGAPQMQNPPQR